jgi:hypothetical protein
MHNTPSFILSQTRVDPSTLPVSLVELKAHLSIFGSNDDARLTALEWGAVDWIERQLNRFLSPTTVVECWPRFPTVFMNGEWYGYSLPFWPYPLMQTPAGLPWRWGEMQRMEFSRSPVNSLTSLSFYDVNNALQTLTVNTDYYLLTPAQRPGFVQPVQVWPVPFYRPDAVKATYVAGYSALPGCLNACVKLLVGAFNENREDFNVQSTACVPIGVQALLASVATGSF